MIPETISQYFLDTGSASKGKIKKFNLQAWLPGEVGALRVGFAVSRPGVSNSTGVMLDGQPSTERRGLQMQLGHMWALDLGI
jgi:hypothetical protein